MHLPHINKKDIILKCFICEILETLSQHVVVYEVYILIFLINMFNFFLNNKSIWTKKIVAESLLTNINEKNNNSVIQKIFWIIFNLLSSPLFLDFFISLKNFHQNIVDFVFRRTDFADDALRIFVVISRKANYYQLTFLENDAKLIELFTFVIKEIRETKLLKLALEGLYNVFLSENQEVKENFTLRNFVLKFESLNGENALIELQHYNNSDVYNLVFMIFDDFIQINQN